MGNATRAVTYARVSSAGQRERDTIASQLRDLPAFVERQGWTLVRPAETYVDDGRSAKAGNLDKREGLLALLRDAAAGMFEVVVVADVDRPTRSEQLGERYQILGALQLAGVRVAEAMGGVVHDMDTITGDMMIAFKAAAAADENRKRAARAMAGKVTAIQRGWKPSGPTPFGLTWNRATHEWAIHPDHGPLVREMFERVASGESCEMIALDLEARGLSRPRGGMWIRERVHQIVTKRTYVGEWLADKRRGLVVKVPAVITEDLWRRTQAALTAHHRRGLRRTKHVYLLEDLATCAGCGAPIGIRSRSSYVAGGERRYNPAAYVCSHRRRPPRGIAPCTATIAQAADVDARVWAAICRELEDPELVSYLAGKRSQRTDDRRNWKADADGYRRKLARLDRHEAAVLARHRRGLITESGLDAELAAIVRERDMLTAQVETAEHAAEAAATEALRTGDARELVERLRARIADATPSERRRLVRALVPRGAAILEGGRVRLTMEVGPAAGTVASLGGPIGVVASVEASR